ncbi:MAG: flagellar biosynthetic protein FliR [Acidimicrobiales bacterium]
MQLSFNPAWMVAFMFATIRCGAWLSIAPPFQGAVPAKIRAGLSMALGLAMTPRLMASGKMPSNETWGLLVGALHQAVIGLALGFLVFVLFQAVAAAGGMIDAFAALTSAQLFDPFSKTSAGPVSRLYQTLGTAVLFVTNGHLMLIAGLSRTFDLAPVSGFRMDRLGSLLIHDVLTFLTAALQIAAPILGALFVTEILLGLASRAAPKLNIMVLGFGAKSLVMFMLLGAAIPLVPYVTAQLVKNSLSVMRLLVKGG